LLSHPLVIIPVRLNDTHLSDKIIHKQLAKAGIRLAAVLNSLLLPPDTDSQSFP